MGKLIDKISRRIKVFQLEKRKVFIANSVGFNSNTIFKGANSIGRKTNIKDSIIGYASYMGKECQLSHVKIGKFCSLASNIKVLVNNHPAKDFVSTHPAFHRASHKLMKKLGLSFANEDLYPAVA